MGQTATFDEMLDQICRQGNHVSSLHRLATAMSLDGSNNEAVNAFASLGASGRAPQNVERDLHVWLANLHNLGIKLRSVDIDVVVNSVGDIERRAIPILAPHDIIAAAYRKGPLVWQTAFLGDHTQQAVLDFWENFVQQPYGAMHPIMKSCEALDSIIPLVFHIDGAESFRNVEAIIWSMSSVFCNGNVFDFKFPLRVVLGSSVPTPALLKFAHKQVSYLSDAWRSQTSSFELVRMCIYNDISM